MNHTPARKVVSFPAQNGAAPSDRLDSWKEIAAYLNRGTRTVQRWERDEGLPVHRLQHDKLGSVYAFRSELDAWWAGRGTAPPAGAQGAAPSIAVLPFADLSREQDQQYFCEGVAEEILHALSRLRGLRVVSRTSCFRFGGGAGGACEIGRKLRVKSLLEGSVRKSGDRLRISVQLTNAEDGYQVWAETFDCRMTDIFAIQEEIARRVAQSLEITLSQAETDSLGTRPTQNIEAYDYYLRGRSFYYRYGPRDVEFAKQLFLQAVACDPHYALAHAGLADCWSYLYLYAGRREESRRQAEQSASRP
jgi:TolB-like protein